MTKAAERETLGGSLCGFRRDELDRGIGMEPDLRFEQTGFTAQEDPDGRLRRLPVYPQTVRTLIYGHETPPQDRRGMVAIIVDQTAIWMAL